MAAFMAMMPVSLSLAGSISLSMYLSLIIFLFVGSKIVINFTVQVISYAGISAYFGGHKIFSRLELLSMILP
jgi:hypothetical protein